MSANKINANVSFDIPAILSNPELAMATYSDPEKLQELIDKLNITGVVFTFKESNGTTFEKAVRPGTAGTGKVSTTVQLNADSEYDVTCTLEFSDKDDVTSDPQTILTDDETEYGQIAKRIFVAVPGGRARPLGGAEITIPNPDGADWTATSRESDGLVYLQRIPVGSYGSAENPITVTKAGHVTGEFTVPIEVTTDGINWNDSQPVYTIEEEPVATGTGE
jgi:hypothetical protein